MPLVIKEQPKKEYQLPSAQVHQAVCYNVFDLGYQKTTFGGETHYRYKVMLGWELNEPVAEGKFAGKRLTLHKQYTASLFQKSTLYKDIQSWIGRPLTAEEVKSFDLESLVGKQCLMNIVHEPAKMNPEKIYANIASIMPLPAVYSPLVPENDRITPDWVAKIIQSQIPAEIAEGGHEEGAE